MPALVFSLTNSALKNKTEIVKTLLAHGADPSVVQHLVSPSDASGEGKTSQPNSRTEGGASGSDEPGDDSPLAHRLRQSINPAIRYYLSRPGATTQTQLAALQGGQYDQLLGARFYLVGQDLALDEMMRAVASHARRSEKGKESLSLVLSGPSGHGKSYLASKSEYTSCIPGLRSLQNWRSELTCC